MKSIEAVYTVDLVVVIAGDIVVVFIPVYFFLVVIVVVCVVAFQDLALIDVVSADSSVVFAYLQ